MGGVLCCFRGGADDCDDEDGRCGCWPFSTAYSSLRQRAESRVTPAHPTPALPRTAALDEFRAPPRPLPFDDPRFSKHLHHKNGAAANPRNASSRGGEACEVSRSTDGDVELACSGEDPHGSSLKDPGAVVDALNRIYDAVAGEICSSTEDEASFSDDEDCCPICLEEYSRENPSKLLQCGHQFHLGCILEWMERSEECPVCSRVMLFDDSDQ